MQTTCTYNQRTIHLGLSEEEASKLIYLLLFAVDWENDLHGRFAQALHDELEALEVKPKREA